MPTVELRIPKLHPGQQRIRDSSARFKVAAIGRRWGKTHYGIDEAAECMLAGGKVGWFAPTYKLLGGEGGSWPDAVRLLRPIISRVVDQEKVMRVVTGGSMEGWSVEDHGVDKARGREYDRIIVDEGGMMPNLVNDWSLALRPMLTTREGDALFLSTPRGFNGFYELYKRGVDPGDDDWAAFHAPSKDSPFFPENEWQDLLREVQRGTLSAAYFAQEYEAIFTAPQGLVYGLDRDGIAFYEPSRTIRSAPVAWTECKWRLAAIDPGGGSDPTGLLALGVTGDDRHHVYAAQRLEGQMSVFDYAEWLQGLNAQGPLDAVVVGETGGDPVVESLRRMGWRAFKAALKPGDKGRGIQHTRGLLKSGRLTIAPALRELFDGEVYVYLFRQREAGQAGGDTWATVVESAEHHAELLDCLRYGSLAVLDGYPSEIQVGGVRRAAGRRVSRDGTHSSQFRK